MSVPSAEGGRPALRVRLAADTPSVPGARRFVADGLRQWHWASLLDDASLVVTEMAANAALHSGSPYMHVSIEQRRDGVRIAVEDDGARVPLAAVVPPPRTTDDELDEIEAMAATGRGLAIVSMLSRRWGIDEDEGRRRIWADLTGDGAEHGVRPPELGRLPGASGAPAAPDTPAADPRVPEGWKTVRLLRSPVLLSMRIDQHLDDLVRELQLIDAGDDAPSREIAQLIDSLVSPRAFARHMGRRAGQDAVAAGLELVDIEMTMPRAAAPDMVTLLELVEEADVLCREQRLLTLASTPEMTALRRWFTESMVGQLEHDAEPVSYADWLARR